MEALDIDTPNGPGRLLIDAPDAPRAAVLLGHGAGGGADAFDLVALAERLPGRGIAVGRYEQPWRVAGRKVAGPPRTLDRGWLPAAEAFGERFAGLPWFAGGRSAGARVACRCFGPGTAGVVALSFPLFPPGKDDRTRVAELAGVRGPVLIVQGDRDPFGSDAVVRATCAEVEQAGERTVVGVPGAHSFTSRSKAAREAAGALAESFADAVGSFVDAVVAPPRDRAAGLA
ncbi:alpha/beta hydrolase family protein [Nigerium massiliense]|uniref:alpha/beta hydrolase family protein n=1 Tax=Nigerium massiliense TaxID=1522317 RepID=UPI000694A546|nr:alpha/beta family hydrolase [Nigerium massiliense]